MRAFVLFVLVTLFTTVTAEANGFRAAHFRGIYDILSERAQAPLPKFVLDNDTLENIWNRWADGPLPADLEQYRAEPTIFAAFTNRNLYFFTFERSALISGVFLALQGPEQSKLELRNRGDGTYDLATREKGVVTYYQLASPVPINSN